MIEPAHINKTNRNIRLRDGLHEDVKARAASLRITLESAYEDALLAWLAKDAPSQASLSKVRSRVISDAILKLKEVIATLGNAQSEGTEMGTDPQDTAKEAEVLLRRGGKPGKRAQVVPKHS